MTTREPLFKLQVYNNGDVEIIDEGKNVVEDPDLNEIKGKDIAAIRKATRVSFIQVNPIWVNIGGRWYRIG